MTFDGGPYVLLDRVGLAWAFVAVALDLETAIALEPIDRLYSVALDDDEPLEISADCERTAVAIERRAPGQGKRYAAFVARMGAIHERTRPLLTIARPSPLDVLRSGAWRDVPFLARSLADVLVSSGLTRDVVRAIAIWTHIAGQDPARAPSVMALIPAVIHRAGAYYARGGIATIAGVLASRAAAEGVECRWETAVRSIRTRNGRVEGVETDEGVTPADAVISNAHGVGTYLDLLDTVPDKVRRTLEQLPLQSPGVCAYLRVRTTPRPPYLRFRLGPGRDACRLLVMPGVVDRACAVDGWWPARFIAPLDHAHAVRLGAVGQRELLHAMLDEPWWRAGISEYEVISTRVPSDWGKEFRLHRDSMNPVMTARAMRAGRLPHRSPYVDKLYLAGGSTHPGQWVSFCAISGVLAADQLHDDLA